MYYQSAVSKSKSVCVHTSATAGWNTHLRCLQKMTMPAMTNTRQIDVTSPTATPEA